MYIFSSSYSFTLKLILKQLGKFIFLLRGTDMITSHRKFVYLLFAIFIGREEVCYSPVELFN